MLPKLRTEIPGPRSRELSARLRTHESRNVTFVSDGWPVFWERAKGVNVWDVDGNRFLDLTSAFGVASLGHAHADLRNALKSQAGTLFHAMGDVHPAALKVDLCTQLSALTFERWNAGPGKVILGSSGFEAVEAALKTALLATGRRRVVAFEGGYHGLGFGALSVGGLPYFGEPFRAQLSDFATLFPYPRNSAQLASLATDLENALSGGGIGAVLVEPIQGRGGCVVPPPEFLKLLRRLCDTHGALLILDEILTGFNRTGMMFACEHAGVVPDLICLGKALTGGFPLSACVGRASVMDAWPESRGEALHTSTFLGNPIGCAMALASLKLHAKPATAALARERGESLRRALAGPQSPHIKEIRGAGLMLGVELTDGALASALVTEALRAGIILLADSPAGNVLSFTPPFSIDEKEVAFVARWFASSIARMTTC
jgi:4-aminobutyrate aminotransferase-like enzyme